MIQFDAHDEREKIEIIRKNGTNKILEINYIGEKEFIQLNKIEGRRIEIEKSNNKSDSNDMLDLFKIAFEQISILSSNATKQDIEGMPIIRVFELVGEMTKLAMGHREGEAKKKVVRKRRRR